MKTKYKKIMEKVCKFAYSYFESITQEMGLQIYIYALKPQ